MCYDADDYCPFEQACSGVDIEYQWEGVVTSVDKHSFCADVWSVTNKEPFMSNVEIDSDCVKGLKTPEVGQEFDWAVGIKDGKTFTVLELRPKNEEN